MNLPSLLRKAIGSVGAATGMMAPALSSSFWGWLREPFAGAWQRNVAPEQPHNLLAFSAVYACVTLIADDISKLRPMLMQRGVNGIRTEIGNGKDPYLATIRKPNRYQNRIQYLQQYLSSKLLHGNTFVLKDRDPVTKQVTALYVLNPFFVKPLVANDGSVYYQLSIDWLAGVGQSITVPASEIIHDRCTAIWHPLVGVSPIYACGASATQGIRIQANSAHFFENQSRPSGQLTSPGTIDDVTAERLKREFETNFSHGNIGKLFVAGDGLKYEGMSLPPIEAQMVEQLGWTVSDVARAFKVPMYKLGGPMPSSMGSTVSAINQDYYTQALQTHIESLELCWQEGLEFEDPTYGVSLDLEGLQRLDPMARAEFYAKMIQSAVFAPNDARLRENLPPVQGGETPYLQQQNYSLEALAARDAGGTPAPGGPPPPGAVAAEFLGLLERLFTSARGKQPKGEKKEKQLVEAISAEFERLAAEAPPLLLEHKEAA